MEKDELQSASTETDSLESQIESQHEPQNDSQIEPQTELQEGEQDSQSATTDDISVGATVETLSAESQNSQPTAVGDTAGIDVVSPKPKKSYKIPVIIAVITFVVLGVCGTVWALAFNQGKADDAAEDQSTDQSESQLPNLITDFDLAFLEDKESNQLYSPLSIKYALSMLEVGAAGNSQRQIEAAIGSLTPQKYPNNANMSFANALFINNALPDDAIKSSYTKTISERFGAETLRVPFTSAGPINNWIGDKTFGLINDLLTDEMLKTPGGPEQHFALVNALAIDMEWINKIQPFDKDYSVKFPHINYGSYVFQFRDIGFTRLPFNDSSIDVNSLHLAATIHKYDILSDLGVDNIRQTIIDEYTKWLNDENGAILCDKDMNFPAPEVYVEQYLEELGDGGYKTVSSSTDFSFYDDDEIKIFAKDLRTYDGVTLQYVGIMPKSISLKNYIQDLTTDKLASAVNQLKPIAFENFKDGAVTNVVANIPVFKFQDKMDLVNTLKGIGITDVFSEKQADLSNLASDPEGLFIGEAVHQTTIDFSNDGIKASAATVLLGGKGAATCGFYYDFDVPVEKIDLTFDNPYLFLIRDKNSGAIWFVGTVYEPTIYTSSRY